MEIKSKVSNLSPHELGGLSESLKKPQSAVSGQTLNSPSFRETLSEISKPQIKNNDLGGLRFSQHAVDRLMSRGIKVSPDDFTRLSQAVDKAASKGSKDSLILMNESAFIVSVKNNTVVTVMDKNNLKDNVFTNIDSTVVI